jgi:CDP-paratose 2-epimerase
MSLAIVTGSAGLIGSETVRFLADRGFDVIGIDNDMRRYFFGDEASTAWNRDELCRTYPTRYHHFDVDIRDKDALNALFARHGASIRLVVHTAAQPSHDWAAREPLTDFGVNALGTLHLLEACRHHAPRAVFVFMSTNKVYGDTPNLLPLVEEETRWEVEASHPFHDGIDESMTVDQSTHSLFGASKLAADVLVQEYARYFDMATVAFRGGCLTGPNHSGTQLHGFLAYLMKCTCTGTPYSVFGYKGKQVRDNIHSADMVSAFYAYFEEPRPGEVYNIGGSRFSHCSMLEAIALCEEISGRTLDWTYVDRHRTGDHIWYVSDIRKFQRHYPGWTLQYDMRALLVDIYEKNIERWTAELGAARQSGRS